MIVAGLITLTVILTGIAIRMGVGITTRVLAAPEPEPLLYTELGAIGVVPAVPVFIAISMLTSLPACVAPVTMVVLSFGTVLTIRSVSASRAHRGVQSGRPTSRRS